MKPAWLTTFELDDFRCRCRHCALFPDRPHTKLEVIRAVQSLRDRLGRALIVSRGVSCPSHNAAVGGAADSRHLPEHADAVDLVAASSREAYEIVSHVIDWGEAVPAWTAIRVYPKHVHLDARPGQPIFIASPT